MKEEHIYLLTLTPTAIFS